MPTRQGASLAKKGSTCDRRSGLLKTTSSLALTLCTWNTFLARSMPIVIPACGRFPSCDSSDDHPMALRCRERAPSITSMRMPTLLPFGEGCTSWEAIDTRTCSIRRGSGHWHVGRVVRSYRGSPAAGEGSGLNVALGAGHGGESDRVIGALRSGNADGAKDPDFWCAFEDGEGMVIGDEPDNTRKDPEPSEEALLQGEGGACFPLLRETPVRSASRTLDTRLARIGTRGTGNGTWAQARPRRACNGSRQQWATCWCPATSPHGRKYATR